LVLEVCFKYLKFGILGIFFHSCPPTFSAFFLKVYFHHQTLSFFHLDGYSQIEIANYLGLSKSLISKVIKSGDSTAGV
jgi:hypothetical protein